MLKDKKFLILIGLIILLPLFTIILTSMLQGCQKNGTTYEMYEKNMINAAKNYFSKNEILPKNEGEVAKVSLSTLVNKKYIKSSSRALKDNSCKGNVTVRLNGSSLEKNEGGFLNYTVYLKCNKYETDTLGSKLKENIVTSKSGLYKSEDGYIFRGDKVNNYINFYNKDYRIMGITSAGLVRLIRAEYEPISRMWDNKYNIEVKQSYGKSIYEDSLILKYLLQDYNNDKRISKLAKEHVVANDTCIGKRSSNDKSISKQTDCNQILKNQFVSLMTVSDYALASTDPDCKKITDRSCNNYNYLKNVSTSTWTSNSVSENTYEVFSLDGGVIMAKNANEYGYYNMIIYIDENEKIVSGKGTYEDPFIIK